MNEAPKIGRLSVPPHPGPLPRGEGACSADSRLFKEHDNGQLVSKNTSGRDALALKSAENEPPRMTGLYDKQPS